MENNVKHYREKSNLTQTELAEKSGLSLRTIQRIEKGSLPKGHTLTSLSNALGIDPDKLLNHTADLEKVKYINISTLSFLILPFANIVLPIILTNKSEDERTKRIGKDIINIQIFWSVVTSFILIVSPFIQHWLSIELPLITICLLVSIGINLFIFLKNAISLNDRSELRIKPILRLL
ncbi:helix-turn-helix domain-containing protein [Roseivirga misakiensis]|uniref:HTH cro/C1-type domain-containing protein n=1 Tax=Roseivirga misakiensis TaxID=1563681 RepID=A0A1E5SZ06_9BACT|nr:helix-turn-helix domain-containing protein [Roseivirga misakiensis]OEK04346.1 hypothetical protein BFP71_12755 [Roseivirga misakiensis]